MGSPKHNFMHAGPEQDYFDGLIHVEREQYKPSKIAIRLHLSLARTKLNVGALGSGKTRSMCEHLNNLCLTYPGARVVVARKDLGDLKKTTQQEYLEKVVSPESIDRFNVNDNTLYYKNNSKCFFMETKTPSNFKSMEIVAYGIDEADENEEGVGKDRLMTMLNGRLRQKIEIDGKKVPVPFAGIWTYNPTTDDHWLAKLEDNPLDDMEIFRSSTYDNESNLPSDYIDSLISSLAPWEINSLIYGNRASQPKGRPVIHGFTVKENVRALQILHHLPLYRGWDWGFNKPAVCLAQFDPEYRRLMIFREILGDKEQLKFFAPKVIAGTKALIGIGHTIFDVCDPHGQDQRDVGESSVEYLRIHHGIHCNFKVTTIKTGLDELQELTLSKDKFKPSDYTHDQVLGEETRLLVDPSCKHLIAALMGGYYRDEDGKPVKDGVYDHICDALRYIIVHTMNHGLVHRMKKQQRFIPRNALTGY